MAAIGQHMRCRQGDGNHVKDKISDDEGKRICSLSRSGTEGLRCKLKAIHGRASFLGSDDVSLHRRSPWHWHEEQIG